MTIIEGIACITLLISIVAIYVKTQVDIAKIQTTISFFQKDLDRKEKALLNLEADNRQDHKEIILKLDCLKKEIC